jgi:serine/threonine protein phosphatase 1
MVARFESPVLYVDVNDRGRDFMVGDIHACFDLVLRAMDEVKFDQACDRIFSVGDLIDRGPGSRRTAKFLSHDWVYAVRGNHEDMVLEIYQDGEPHQAVLDYMHSRNGFDWWRDTPDSVRHEILEAIGKLPIAIELATERGTVGLVHADVPDGLSWPAFLARLEAGDIAVAEKALWGRDRVGRNDESGVDGVGRVFVGHTPLRGLIKLGNVYAIDTGAVFGVLGRMEGALTFAQATAGTALYKDLAEFEPPRGLVAALADPEPPTKPFSSPQSGSFGR